MAASVKHLSADGATQITEKIWPDAIAGEVQTAEKFAVENNGDRDLGESPSALVLSIEKVGTNDGDTMMRIGKDVPTISPPFKVLISLTGAGAGGVFASTGVHSYRITVFNATGETIGSVEVSINVDDVTKKVQLSWSQPPGSFTGYKVYRTTTAGSYPDPSLRATIGSPSTTTFVDDGTAVSTGALPLTNTTGGAGPTFGTPPALGTADLNFGELEIGQSGYYWVNRVIPGGTSETGNPRLAQLKFTEV